MRIKFGRRVATVAAVAVLTASGLGMAAGGASAGGAVAGIMDVNIWGTGMGTGVYQAPTTTSPIVAPALFGTDYAVADCWTRGQVVNNQGNVWYHVYQEHYSGNFVLNASGYVYAPYVYNNKTFPNSYLPECFR
ncbi:hypothetical protein [Embleya sp. AB8]|uniref:hypothetical protein n=1 Tax=Embleya sp. AB8 TaxID=3156304 RepID=UPI003C744740